MSPQPIICDDDQVELATHVISYPDGSRIPEAHCDGHMIPWCLAFLVQHLPPEGLMGAIQFLSAHLPEPEPQEPPEEPPAEPPRRRGRPRVLRPGEQVAETAAQPADDD